MRLGLVLGDQLSLELPSLKALNPAQDAILMAEVEGEARYVPHHPQKIVLVFSAMRHFAQVLRERGWQVHYVPIDDSDNSGTIVGEPRQAVLASGADRPHRMWRVAARARVARVRAALDVAPRHPLSVLA